MISVVVPAHNEERVIERSLGPLVEAAREGTIEILVVCNGCTDATASRARALDASIRVIEISEASKAAALNVADEILATFPRIYLDADVEMSAASMRALVQPLLLGRSDLALATSSYDVSRSSALVRSYLRFWSSLPQVTSVSAGSGVYAVSAAGRSRFGRWPDEGNDDAFVRARLEDSCVIVREASTTVRAPRTTQALVRRKARVVHGNRLLSQEQRFGDVHPWVGWVKALSARPALLRDLPAYLWVTAFSRILTAAGRTPSWAQDETSRQVPTAE